MIQKENKLVFDDDLAKDKNGNEIIWTVEGWDPETDDLQFYFIDAGIVTLLLHHRFHEGLIALVVFEPLGLAGRDTRHSV